VTLITPCYAQAARSGPWHEAWALIRSYPEMLAAFAGFSLLALAGITSYRIVRQRLRYETWWVVHLYLYLGLALAFAHQVVTGVSFTGRLREVISSRRAVAFDARALRRNAPQRQGCEPVT
jgi:DMSO/TMAO reductase YedYZ heme-binding membrane subunit